jgi:DNA-binding transcriptional regulator YdaS (Cro superfamily)
VSKELDWIHELRVASTPTPADPRRSQATAAAKIGYSPSVVNQVLKGTYKGDLKSVQRAVEGALMGATVECPVIGELSRARCIEYQRAGFRATNPMRVALSRACPTCPNRRS